MDEEGFRKFLKRSGRSQSAAEGAVTRTKEFEQYLQERGKSLDKAAAEDLRDFVAWIEKKPKTSVKMHLWGICYYYLYTSREEMSTTAHELRQQRIKRKPFALKDFRGVNPEYVRKLAAVKITQVEQMVKAGRTRSSRQELSEKTGVPRDAILELVKLSDLARIQGLKSIRARLYYDAGVDTVEKLAGWGPEELREMLIKFVEKTGFDGIAPLPKEVASAVETAKNLSKVVEYE